MSQSRPRSASKKVKKPVSPSPWKMSEIPLYELLLHTSACHEACLRAAEFTNLQEAWNTLTYDALDEMCWLVDTLSRIEAGHFLIQGIAKKVIYNYPDHIGKGSTKRMLEIVDAKLNTLQICHSDSQWERDLKRALCGGGIDDLVSSVGYFTEHDYDKIYHTAFGIMLGLHWDRGPLKKLFLSEATTCIEDEEHDICSYCLQFKDALA